MNPSNNMAKLASWQAGLIVLLIAGAMAARLAPHMPNVAPVAATALLAGAFLPGAWAFIVPVTAMGLSDYFIGTYEWPVMAAVYGSFMLTVGIGRWVGQNRNAGRIVLSSLGGSVLFYLITNWAVWQFGNWYPPTLDGLIQSYYYAIPFFRNTLLGDVMYASGLFIIVEAATLAVHYRKASGLERDRKFSISNFQFPKNVQ